MREEEQEMGATDQPAGGIGWEELKAIMLAMIAGGAGAAAFMLILRQTVSDRAKARDNRSSKTDH